MFKESEFCDCCGSSRAARRCHTVSWKIWIMLLPLKNSLICFMEFILFYLCVSLSREGWRVTWEKYLDVSVVYGEVTSSVQLLSHVQLFATSWACMPGVPAHHQLPELAHTHVHQVWDAIQPSHPLSSPFPLALNLSQHQGLFYRDLSAQCGGRSKACGSGEMIHIWTLNW